MHKLLKINRLSHSFLSRKKAVNGSRRAYFLGRNHIACRQRTMTTNLAQNLHVDPAELPDEALIFGSTPAMREVRRRIDRILASDLPVLIEGETGTGKEVIARYLHAHSSRAEAPFVRLNCSAVPVNLLESELFGYRKGAFTGAKVDRPGLIEIADGGTLFLDEIDELHWSLQGKLLQFLQDGSFTPIGGSHECSGRVRVICATNVNLQNAVKNGAFREDLFYRIEVVSLRLPALRERKNDIPRLCDYFLTRLARKFAKNAPRLDPAVIRLLMQWDWPGNLRELENWVARAIILGDAEATGAELKRRLAKASTLDSRMPRTVVLKEISRKATSAASNATILKALQANRWNRRKTAEDLHMSYRSLLYKLREVGIPLRRRGHRGFQPPAH
jgi:two-component system, NtrC family, response regulator AtoC